MCVVCLNCNVSSCQHGERYSSYLWHVSWIPSNRATIPKMLMVQHYRYLQYCIISYHIIDCEGVNQPCCTTHAHYIHQTYLQRDELGLPWRRSGRCPPAVAKLRLRPNPARWRYKVEPCTRTYKKIQSPRCREIGLHFDAFQLYLDAIQWISVISCGFSVKI